MSTSPPFPPFQLPLGGPVQGPMPRRFLLPGNSGFPFSPILNKTFHTPVQQSTAPTLEQAVSNLQNVLATRETTRSVRPPSGTPNCKIGPSAASVL